MQEELTSLDSCVGHFVSRATYGDQIWGAMKDDLTHWNIGLMEILNETMLTFWMVDVFHFCKF
jgi:hypothetical protein